MQVLVGVQVIQRKSHLHDDARDAILGQCHLALLRPPDHPPQVSRVAVLHDDLEATAVFARALFDEGHDVRVHECPERLCLQRGLPLLARRRMVSHRLANEYSTGLLAPHGPHVAERTRT